MNAHTHSTCPPVQCTKPRNYLFICGFINWSVIYQWPQNSCAIIINIRATLILRYTIIYVRFETLINYSISNWYIAENCEYHLLLYRRWDNFLVQMILIYYAPKRIVLRVGWTFAYFQLLSALSAFCNCFCLQIYEWKMVEKLQYDFKCSRRFFIQKSSSSTFAQHSSVSSLIPIWFLSGHSNVSSG